MAFNVRIKPPAVREAQIANSTKASTETQEFYDFRNTKTDLKKVRLPQDMLVYRMENFRTFTGQRAYIKREGKAADYFLAGQENESVQQIQHDILAQLARKGRADSVVPVIDVLKTERQREPLLITHKGVVVNGNRRLAAMRELLAEPDGTYQEFEHVTCLVLPEDATPDDIVDIEAALQGRPETKLDYDWIGEAQLIKRLKDIGRTDRQLAARLNRKPAEIRNLLAALNEANLYLKDWAKAEGEYALVADAEQLFNDLPGLLEGKDQNLADASRAIAWSLLDNKDLLGERLYAFNPTIGKQAPDVLDRLSSELGVAVPEPAEEDDDDFAIDIGEDAPSYQPIVDVLKDPAKREEAVETLVEVCREVIEEERGKKTGRAALKAITAANSRLMEVDLGKAEKSTYAAIKRQLEQVQKRVEELTATIDQLLSKPKTDDSLH